MDFDLGFIGLNMHASLLAWSRFIRNYATKTPPITQSLLVSCGKVEKQTKYYNHLSMVDLWDLFRKFPSITTVVFSRSIFNG